MPPSRAEKIARLTATVRRLAAEADVESLARGRPPGPPRGDAYESMDVNPAAESGLQKLLAGRGDQLTEDELYAQEAVVMPAGRPAVFIRGGAYDALDGLWAHLNDEPVRRRLEPLFAAVGRVELPTNPRLPYGGTGFVVGRGLLMTNRHVAALFAGGVGDRGLVYRPGDAAVHFKRQYDDPHPDPVVPLAVTGVAMIHPYWDMALLRVEGLEAVRPLTLSVDPPETLAGGDVAAVGYPALDDRNDFDTQNRVFGGVYQVKRLMPGKVLDRAAVRSFEATVSAVTHDGSTLGGASGSAVLDVATGRVVGLHFAGVYLRANYAVPTYELARDPRVVAAGVNFAGPVRATADFDAAWARVRGESPPPPPGPVSASVATLTVPLVITVSVGTPAPAAPTLPPAEAEGLRVPVIFPHLDDRAGYRPDFLGLPRGAVVPLPTLTPAGRQLAAKRDDGGTELRYHRFSVVMHKRRRLALFAAANVDWRPAGRLVNGRKPSRKELTGLGPNDVEQWVTDPRIPDDHQLPDVFFTKDGGAFDKGHLVRREDVAWGDSFADMQAGNGDTYHTTNCSPQVAGFNRSARGVDNWGDLENVIRQEAKAERVCVFAGPVLAADDPTFVGRDRRGTTRVQVPRKFWKVVAAVGPDGPAAYGFVLEQDLTDVTTEFVVPAAWRKFLVEIAAIEEMLGGLATLTWLKAHDAGATPVGERLRAAVGR